MVKRKTVYDISIQIRIQVAQESYCVLTFITPELISIVCPSKIADRTASTVPAVFPCNMMLLKP